MMDSRKKIGEYFFLFAVIVAFSQSVVKLINRTSTGWDHNIYCKAADVWSRGIDPYITENLGMKLSYSYPALFLPLYQPLCSVKFIFIYIDILLLLAIVWMLVRHLSSNLVVALPIVLLGYNSMYSNIETGNLGVFEAFFLTLAIVFTVRRKSWSSVCLVPMAFLKLVPSILALPIWLSSKKWKERWIQFSFFVGGIVLLNGINILFSKDLALSFFMQLTGSYNQHSPANEITANASNPTTLLFFKNLASMLSEQYWYGIFAVLIAGLAALTYWVWDNTIRKEADILYRLCWSYLLVLLWIPRLKPYALILLCVVMAPLLSRVPKRFAFWIFILTVFHRVLNGTKTNVWWELISNNTAIYTMIAVLVLLTIQWKKKEAPKV